MASAVTELCKGLEKDFVEKLVKDHAIFLAESSGAYRVKPNKVFVEHLDSEHPDSLMSLAHVQTFVEAVDKHFLKRISGPACKTKTQYKEWAKLEAKRGKKLVRAHRRNLGKVKGPTKLKKPLKPVSSAKITARTKVKKTSKKVIAHRTHKQTA